MEHAELKAQALANPETLAAYEETGKEPNIFEFVNETVEGLYQAGVMALKTLREFQKLCLHTSSIQKE